MPMTWALVTARIVRLEFPSDDVGRVIEPYRPERHLHAPTQLRTFFGLLDLFGDGEIVVPGSNLTSPWTHGGGDAVGPRWVTTKSFNVPVPLSSKAAMTFG